MTERKWYRVEHRTGDIAERNVLRDTAKMIFHRDWRGREVREAKSDSFGVWYPTRDEAEAASNAIKKRISEKAALRLKEKAAPELYEALEAMQEAYFDYHDANALTQPVTGRAGSAMDKAIAALAKARGEA